MGFDGQYDRRIPLLGYAGQQDSVADGSPILLKSNRQGGLIVADQLQQWAIEGKTYHAQQGDAGTKLDFAETAYDEDQPQFALRIPTGTVVIPLSLVYTFQDMAGTDNQVIWSTTTNDIGSGTSTAATISNMRPDVTKASTCTARSLYTANATAATGLFEFARFLDAFADAATGPHPRFEWNIRTAAAIPVLKGPATLQSHVFATGDGPEGFGEFVWAEFDAAALVGV
jgi:hypothetical protein